MQSGGNRCCQGQKGRLTWWQQQPLRCVGTLRKLLQGSTSLWLSEISNWKPLPVSGSWPLCKAVQKRREHSLNSWSSRLFDHPTLLPQGKGTFSTSPFPAEPPATAWLLLCSQVVGQLWIGLLYYKAGVARLRPVGQIWCPTALSPAWTTLTILPGGLQIPTTAPRSLCSQSLLHGTLSMRWQTLEVAGQQSPLGSVVGCLCKYTQRKGKNQSPQGCFLVQ